MTAQTNLTEGTVEANLRPTRASGAFAVLLGLFAVVSLDAATVGPALAVEGVGLALLTGGLTLLHRGHRLAGGVLLAGAAVAALGALALLVIVTGEVFVAGQFVPGMVGVVVLALGVVPGRGDGSRRLVKAGTALVFLTVFAVGVVTKPSLGTLLVGGVAAVLAWDAGEQAVGLGRQLGRRAETYRAEAVHAVGSVVVGVGAVLAGRGVDGIGSPGLPLSVFALLVIGLVLLAGALHD